MNKVVFPGSFDPFTIGHLDLVIRASNIYDSVIILVTKNVNKNSLIPFEKKIDLIEQVIAELNLENVHVDFCNTLVVDYCSKNSVNLILRGLRSGDFDYEYNLGVYNFEINPKIETIYMFAKPSNMHISSSGVKELLKYNKNIDNLVPYPIDQYFKEENENL